MVALMEKTDQVEVEMMKLKIGFYLLLLAATFSMSSCVGRSVEPSANPIELIANTSFEAGGQPSATGWSALHGSLPTLDSNFFSTDVPPGGGLYSIKLFPGWLPMENAVEYDCAGQPSGVYKLSAWSKIGWGTRMGISSISLARKSNGIFDRKKLLLSDSVWTQHALVDTLSLGPSDTLEVILSAGATELVSFEQLFDLVSLTKVQ